MNTFKEQIEAAILKVYPELNIQFTNAPCAQVGHLSMPLFGHAKALRRPPFQIAEDLMPIISSLDFIEKVEMTGGYINIFVILDQLYSTIIEDVFHKKESYGSTGTGKNKKILMEHTSINPNASPHVGRARNAMIGDTIVRLLRFQGYDVDVHYFVNDIGKQIAMLLLGTESRESYDFHDLLDIYIEINEAVKENPAIEQEVFALLNLLESGHVETKNRFRDLVNICIKGQTNILKQLGITYDTFDYESEYLFNNRMDEVLEAFKQTGKLEEDEEGRYCLNLSDYGLPLKSPYLVLTRKDKTSLYPLRDISYTIDKMKADVDQNLIVLGEDQKVYHQEVKAALDILGHKAPDAIHYSFVLLKEGKMASRNGTVVLLEDFMEEAYEKAKIEIGKRRDVVNDETAKSIAYASVKYAILKTSNEKNVTFTWDQALSFEGDSAPYCLYSLARIYSIMEKTDSLSNHKAYNEMVNAEEIELAIEISKMYDMIETAEKTKSPHIVVNYLYDVTRRFSSFYHACSINDASTNQLKSARYDLTMATKQVIENCFQLLGIDIIKKM